MDEDGRPPGAAHDRPAMVNIPLGKGAVYYFATPLERESCHRFFDLLYDVLDVTRLSRTVDAQGGNLFGIDSRTVTFDAGYLSYIVNLHQEPCQVRLQLPEGVTTVTNLSAEEQMELGEEGVALLSMGRFETVLLRLD